MDVTTWIIVAVLVLLFGADLWLLVTRDYKATVSATLLRLSKGYPIIPFLIGIALGHVLWVNEAAVLEAVEQCEREHR